MKTTFREESIRHIVAELSEANASFNRRYPGDGPARQPVHTVYGGAQIFKAETAKKLCQKS